MMVFMGTKCKSAEAGILDTSLAESEKDGEPRNQVPEDGFKSEEGWHEIFNSLLKFFRI